MSRLFLHLLNMSIPAGWVVMSVVLLRLCIRRAPKWISVLLWGMVAVRLLFPFSIESSLSMLPTAETVPGEILYTETPQIQSGIPVVNNLVNPILQESFVPKAETTASSMELLTEIVVWVWLAGVLLMLGYFAVSYLLLRRRMREAVHLQDNVWICDRAETPFLLGVFRTRIYLPSVLNPQDAAYVIAHEKAHLHRKDHLWKPLGFLLLSVYWFHPLLWVAYVLLCRDIEHACDEKVLKSMGADGKKPYSDALINCSASHRMLSACPLAFGEVGVKSRVKSVLHYKKPTLWVLIVALLISSVAAVWFLTDPPMAKKESEASHMTENMVFPGEKDAPYSFTYVVESLENPNVDGKLETTFSLNSVLFNPAYEGNVHLQIPATVGENGVTCILANDTPNLRGTKVPSLLTEKSFEKIVAHLEDERNFTPTETVREHTGRNAKTFKAFFLMYTSQRTCKCYSTSEDPCEHELQVREWLSKYPFLKEQGTLYVLEKYITVKEMNVLCAILEAYGLDDTAMKPYIEEMEAILADYPENLQEFGVNTYKYSFMDPSCVTEVTLPETVWFIEEGSFNGYDNLQKVNGFRMDMQTAIYINDGDGNAVLTYVTFDDPRLLEYADPSFYDFLSAVGLLKTATIVD